MLQVPSPKNMKGPKEVIVNTQGNQSATKHETISIETIRGREWQKVC
jgi:hypothetical protein